VGLTQDKRGKVKVDEHLRACLANGAVSKDVFVGGDLADTMYSGLAQTAHYDGHIIATNIAAMIYGAPLAKNANTHRGCLVAMGREWSIWTKGKRYFSGKLIWHLRRLIDLKSYLQILPLRKALDIWLSEDEPWEEFDRVARERMEEKYRSK
jgi:NADH dehydrogenase FAD-containing subunit